MRYLAILLVCAMPLGAQRGRTPPDTGKAAAIVARYTAAIGGEAAVRALTQYHAVLQLSSPATSWYAGEARQDVYMKAPNLLYMRLNAPPFGAMEVGFNGRTAWTNSAATGPVVHERVPGNLMAMVNAAAPRRLLDAKCVYDGRREFAGRSFDAVRAVFPDGQSSTHYFDVKTGLLSGMDPEGREGAASERMTVTLDDYQRLGALLQPTKLTTLMYGQEIVVRVVSVSHAPLDASVFEPPPALRQRLSKP